MADSHNCLRSARHCKPERRTTNALRIIYARDLDGQVIVAAPGEFVMVTSPQGLRLGFQKVPDPTPGKNRVHLDLHSIDRERDSARLIAAGATEVSRHAAGADFGWVVLSDPDGNVFCVAGAP
jgi:predicted enzyme related to lactoylglutathione lyase